MASLFMLALCVAGGALYVADSLRGYGVNWASEVCWTAGALCAHSDLIGLIAAGAGFLFFVFRCVTA